MFKTFPHFYIYHFLRKTFALIRRHEITINRQFQAPTFQRRELANCEHRFSNWLIAEHVIKLKVRVNSVW